MAGTSLRELITKWSLVVNTEQIDKLNAGLEKSKEKLHAVGEQSSSMEKLAHSMEGVRERLDLIIGYEAIKGIAEMAEKFAELGEQINVMAHSLGLGVEQFQQFAYAAKLSAVSQEQLSTGMMRLSRALYDARTGSTEAQLVFQHLGVPPGQISNLHSASDAMLLLSSRLQAMNDPIAKLALTQKTLGRGSMEMVAFLSQGPAAIQEKMRAAQRDGLILSESQVEGLERMNHAFERMGEKLKVVMASFVAPLAPVVERLVNDFIKLYNANEKWIGLNVEAFATRIIFALGWLDGFITTFVSKLHKHLGDNGVIGAIFGDVAVVGTILTALTAVVTVIKLITGLVELSGLGALFRLLGAGVRGAAGLFGAGAAEAEAAGASYTMWTGGAVAAEGGAAATGVGGALSAPFLAALLAGGGLGLAFDRLMDFLTRGGFSNFVGAPGAALSGLMQPSTEQILQQYGTPKIEQHIHPSQGMDEKALANLVGTHTKKALDQHQREIYRGTQTPKVGNQ